MRRLFHDIREGKPAERDGALEVLLKNHIKLVIKISHFYKNQGLPLKDLIAEGNIGLLKAVDKFDLEKGVKFSTYATFWIKHAIRRALSNHGRTIRVPCQTAENIRKVKSARRRMANELGREPTRLELAEDVGLSEKVVRRLILEEITVCSLNAPIDQEGTTSLEENISNDDRNPEEILMRKESLDHLEELIGQLDERENKILRMRFGLDVANPKTLEYISERIGLSRERVRQILRESLRKLRRLIKVESGERRVPTAV